MKRGGLGRGLDVLLPQSGELLETVVRDISIDEIDPNASQPRRDFDKEALEQLADSIREAGVLSPILVVENGMRYRIVAGERRYRAARLAGLETVTCIVRSMTNEQQMEAALIENLQRQDLNPIEEAAAIRSLMQECGYTQEQAARKLGKSRPAIANALRLLNLPKAVTDLVVTGDLSAGHARVLAGLDSEARPQELADPFVLNRCGIGKPSAGTGAPVRAARIQRAKARGAGQGPPGRAYGSPETGGGSGTDGSAKRHARGPRPQDHALRHGDAGQDHAFL